MPKGRKPVLISLADNNVAKRTKKEIDLRAELEVHGCSADLKPPKELSPRAKKEWKRLIRLYRQLNYEILNDLDLHTLAAYCESVAVYKEAESEWQKKPLVGVVDGKIVENPYIRIMDRESQNIARLAEQLMLSAVGRARMGAAAARRNKSLDPMEEFLRKIGYEE